MNRRQFLAGTGVILPAVTGCVSRETQSATTTPETKPGTVDNHRITAVEAVSHDAARRSTDDGHRWVVRVVLRIKPQDPETATPFPVGVFFIFFDDSGRELYEEYETVPANTSSNSYTVTLSAVFLPSEASSSTFSRYRIDLVHA